MNLLNILKMNVFFNDEIYEVDNHDIFDLVKNLNIDC